MLFPGNPSEILHSPFSWGPLKHSDDTQHHTSHTQQDPAKETSADGANRSSQAPAPPPPPTPEGEGRSEGAADRKGSHPRQPPKEPEAKKRCFDAQATRPAERGQATLAPRGGAQELPESNHGPTRKEGSREAEGRRRGGPAFSHAPHEEGTRESASRVGTCSASFRGKKNPLHVDVGLLDFIFPLDVFGETHPPSPASMGFLCLGWAWVGSHPIPTGGQAPGQNRKSSSSLKRRPLPQRRRNRQRSFQPPAPQWGPPTRKVCGAIGKAAPAGVAAGDEASISCLAPRPCLLKLHGQPRLHPCGPL